MQDTVNCFFYSLFEKAKRIEVEIKNNMRMVFSDE